MTSLNEWLALTVAMLRAWLHGKPPNEMAGRPLSAALHLWVAGATLEGSTLLLTSLNVWLALTVAMLRAWLVNRRMKWLVDRFPLLRIYG